MPAQKSGVNYFLLISFSYKIFLEKKHDKIRTNQNIFWAQRKNSIQCRSFVGMWLSEMSCDSVDLEKIFQDLVKVSKKKK